MTDFLIVVNFNAQYLGSQGRSPGLFLPDSYILRKNTLNDPNFIEIGGSSSEELPSFCLCDRFSNIQ